MKTGNSTPHDASAYDDQIRGTIPFYDAFHSETIRLVQSVQPHPRTWIDTGCGTGTLIQKASPLFPDTDFYLADPSPEMIDIARQKTVAFASHVTIMPPCATADLSSVLTIQCDIITAIQAHHYLSPDERLRATNTCRDRLRDGGIYITFENIRPCGDKGIEIGKTLWKNHQLSYGKSEESVRAHLERFDTEYFPITVNEHLTLLKECGFIHADIFWYSVMQAGFYAIK